jgi:sortase A
MTTISTDTPGLDTADSALEESKTSSGSRVIDFNNDRRTVLLGLVGLGILVILVFEFLFSNFLAQRAQVDLLTQLRGTLATSASAYGQPGLSPLPGTAPEFGSAVALIQIPAIGISQVVAEGTSSQITQSGPGHMPGTVLPGQIGESVIVGRRTTFGAPFYAVPNLKVGDKITVTTLEGTSTYKVFTPKSDLLPQNRLVLRTSSPLLLSLGAKDIYAELQNLPFVATPRNAPNEPHKSPWPMLIVALQLVGLAALGVRFTSRKFSRSITWLLCTPLLFGALLALTLSINLLLPATV